MTIELAELTTRLGWRHRNVAVRLAIARSLSLPTPPSPLTEEEGDDKAIPIRGRQLFGEGSDLAAWLALITCSIRAFYWNWPRYCVTLNHGFPYDKIYPDVPVSKLPYHAGSSDRSTVQMPCMETDQDK